MGNSKGTLYRVIFGNDGEFAFSYDPIMNMRVEALRSSKNVAVACDSWRGSLVVEI